MAILLTGAGGLFTRLGKIAGALNDVNTWRGGTGSGQLQKAAIDALTQVDGDANPLIRGSYTPLVTALAAGQASLTSLQKQLVAAAQALLIAQVNADTPLPALTVQNALAVLKAQMITAGAKLSYNTLGASVAYTAGNGGNGVIVPYAQDLYSRPLDNMLAEAIAVTCTADSTAGSESMQFLGAASQPDATHWLWPAGSGCNKTLTSTSDAGGLLTNGNFEAWTANLPNGWTAYVGAAGTQFKQSTSGNAYKGSAALQIIGGTGTLTNLGQTLSTLSIRTPYCINFRVKADVVPAAGHLIVSLADGSTSGNALTAESDGNYTMTGGGSASANHLINIDCSTLTTGYVNYSVVVQLAHPLPPVKTIRVITNPDVSAGSNIFVDSLAMVQMTQLGTQLGDTIFAAVFGGALDWSLGDSATITTTNNRTCKWQQAFDVMFGCRQQGFLLPTNGGGATISDALISD